MEETKNTEEILEERESDASCECEKGEAAEAPKKEKKSKRDAEKKLAEEIEALKLEIKEKDDKYLRMAAEYDNFRRRSREEKDQTYENAAQDTIAELLPIIDNLERAVGVTDADGILKGLEMTLKGADEALQKMGVEAFGAEGDQFDPNIHNAVMMVDDESKNSGEIVSVFQKGYKKGDKIIRYAMVTVAN